MAWMLKMSVGFVGDETVFEILFISIESGIKKPAEAQRRNPWSLIRFDSWGVIWNYWTKILNCDQSWKWKCVMNLITLWILSLFLESMMCSSSTGATSGRRLKTTNEASFCADDMLQCWQRNEAYEGEGEGEWKCFIYFVQCVGIQIMLLIFLYKWLNGHNLLYKNEYKVGVKYLLANFFFEQVIIAMSV